MDIAMYSQAWEPTGQKIIVPHHWQELVDSLQWYFRITHKLKVKLLQYNRLQLRKQKRAPHYLNKNPAHIGYVWPHRPSEMLLFLSLLNFCY